MFVTLCTSSRHFHSLGLQRAGLVAGGEDTTANKFPYLASLRHPSDDSHFCTGAIVAERIVLTAAHCLEPDLGGTENLFVDFGRTCTSCVDERGIRRVSVKRSMKHPKWTGNIKDGADLALLILGESVDGPYLRVLPQEDPAERFGDLQAFKFAGYGLLSDEKLSENLQEADLYYRSDGFCQRIYNLFNYVLEPKDTICATGLGNAEVCRGDSGGPLILRGATPEQDLAVGVLSAGSIGCGEDVELPALFTNLYLYQNDLRLYIPESSPATTAPVPTQPPLSSEAMFALMELKVQNMGAALISDWATNGDFCGWTGVSCDAEGNIQRLEIPSSGDEALRGTLPRQWSLLARLEEMNLRLNEIEGALPREWSTLTNLRRLAILGNRLTGSLPREWSTMTNMETLSLFSNRLTGRLPPEWSTWTRVSHIYLLENSLTGSVPKQWLSGMSALQTLALRDNNVEAPTEPLPERLSLML